MKTLPTAFAIALTMTCPGTTEPSIAERLATSTYVPPPTALESMPSQEWCKVVDAVLANPRANAARKDEYIKAGQANHCPNQMILPPPPARAQRPLSPQEWCADAFKVLGNPFVDSYLKAATLEKARNRGCLN
jgi:hypothetical protein